MIIHLKKENFENEVMKSEIPVLIDFFATWCGPCKMLGPVLEELASEKSEIKFIKIDVDEHEDLARQYGVMSVPTLLFFKDGNLVGNSVGFLPKEVLIQKIEAL